ncbi:pilin [Jatrophihabitans lederbergiae]|uniref:Pilin n=1 Tax=Jatrophihabitans lederbergiae TaxID=3075547 RepID=A0ABU2JGK3_9ACTN|nr:pilin [Jatrophihabitans sp. DSM 44399]MDT0264120.1 pilin [Jatrophihabitans sp. DSM 44399]
MRLTRQPHPATDRHRETTGHRGARWPARRWRLGAAAVVSAVICAALLAPSAAVADPLRELALAGSVDEVLTNVRNWIMGILAGVATVFLTIGGLRYVMAAGDPGEVAKAKIAFKSASIGYALAALAPLVVTVLQGIVGA